MIFDIVHSSWLKFTGVRKILAEPICADRADEIEKSNKVFQKSQ